MDPLSITFRRIVATLFFLLFVAILSVASIYASGYRLGEEFTLERTGGIHVGVPVTGATVLLNGEEVGVSSFLAKSFFIDNLNFGTYDLEVNAPGYLPWKKTLIVEHSLVTATNSFLVPEKTELLPVVVSEDTSSTSTRAVTKEQRADLLALFNPEEEEVVATSTESTKPPIELIVREGNVYVHWNRDLERAPSAFCITPGACVVEVSVESSEDKVTHAEFFRDGVLYQTAKGIFLAEIDVKQPQIVIPIYESGTGEFLIHSGEILILDGKKLFVVSGFSR